jgi:outer membrane protein TolC
MMRQLTAKSSCALFCAALLVAALPVGAEQAPVYDLGQCVAIALQGSPSLAVAGENTEVARQGLKQARGAFLPNLTLARRYQKSERTDFDVTDLAGQLIDQKTKSTYQDYSLDSRWNLFGGFGKFATVASAGHDLHASELDEIYRRQAVVESVVVAYVQLGRNESLLEVAEEAAELAARELEKSETYHRIGSAAKSDVLQAKVRLEQTRLDVIRARNTVEQSFAELAHAMNRPLIERFDVDRSLMSVDFDVEPLESLFSSALDTRADLLSLEYRAEARGKDVTSASAGLWPSLDVSLSYSRYENESPFRFGAQKSDNLSYGYSVTWNVFDRFVTLGNRSSAKARERIAEYNLDQKRLDVQLEVRQLYNSLLEARERHSLAEETIANAQEELRLAQERFKVGAGTMLEQITAQVNLSQAMSDEISARSDYLIASMQMDRAVGRSLEERVAP